MCGAELVSLITAMAVAIAEGRTADEIEILSDVFTQLGDTLATLATQQVRCGCGSIANSLSCDTTKNSQKRT